MQIGGVIYNLELALKRLKHDIRDDWFPDFIEFTDFFENKQFFHDQLIKYSESKGFYEPDTAIHFDIPKPGFTIRYSSETNITDRLMYQACIDKLCAELDSIHSPYIYSHRTNSERNEKYTFRNAVEEWNKFLVDTQLELDNEENEVLLITDLSNYYEYISIQDLIETVQFQIANHVKNAIKREELLHVILQVKKLLLRWCEPITKRGIPQNRDASAFLSNLYLHPVDDIMIKSGFRYFRYMDDIRIVCKNKYEGRKALLLLIQELRKKGLNVNSKKTQILEQNKPSDRLKIFEALQKNDKQIDQIESLLRSRNARGIQIAVPMLRKKTLSLIESGSTLERHFRFCINRLERLVRIPELRDNIDIQQIIFSVIGELTNQPWATDTFSRFLISVPLSSIQLQQISTLLLDNEKNIYDWQEYHIWRILVCHKYKNDELLTKARINLDQRANAYPIVVGSIMYLCAIGDGNDRKRIADNFKQLKTFFVQRAALIGIKDLDYATIIKKTVESHIEQCHIGTYRKLHDSFSNVYVLTPSALNFKDFYDELPEFIS